MVIYWLNPPITSKEIYSDLAWMNFRHYCQEYRWVTPIIDWEQYTTVDSVVQHILDQGTRVLCVSTYVWNYKLCHAVCREVKKRDPSITVIQGGPHQGYTEDFFERHPYIDYLCYATGHGEIFLKAALAQIQEHGCVIEPTKVPHMICREYQSLNEKSRFEYPETSSLEFNQDYLSEIVDFSYLTGYKLKFIYETTRGCPYGCTYCEWGGGTSTKISIKPLEMIKREIDLIAFMKIKHLEFADANAGILERDLDVLEYIGQSKIKYGYPETVSAYGMAKTKLSKKEKYLDLLIKYKLGKTVNLSVQAIDPELLANLKRTDISLEDNIYLAKKYSPEVDVHLELLMGTPGYTLDHFYQEFNVMRECNDSNRKRYILYLLPDSEIYSDVQRKLWKIKTITVKDRDNDLYHLGAGNTSNSVIYGQEFSSSYDIMVSTYSYNTEDWKQMYVMNIVGKLIFDRADQTIPLSDVSLRQIWQSIQPTQHYKELDSYLNKTLADGDKKSIVLDVDYIVDTLVKIIRDDLGFKISEEILV